MKRLWRAAPAPMLLVFWTSAFVIWNLARTDYMTAWWNFIVGAWAFLYAAKAANYNDLRDRFQALARWTVR